MKDLNFNLTISRRKLLAMALVRFIPGIVLLSSILFLSAGTIKYWNAWLLLGVLSIPMLFILIYLITKDPELLQKRLNTRETEKQQKKIVFLTLIMFLSEFILAGLDYRFQWSSLPLWLVVFSSIMVFLGYILFFIVMRQNTYASRVIEIQNKQKVIDTGFYAVVRHPMYLAAIMMFTIIPLLLGSFYAFLIMLAFPVQINMRIKNEEEVLEKGLEGYVEYKNKVRFKVIPYLW